MTGERVVRWVARMIVWIPTRMGLVAGVGLIAVAFTDVPWEMRLAFLAGGVVCIAATLQTWRSFRRELRDSSGESP